MTGTHNYITADWLRGSKGEEPDPPYVPVESPNTARSKAVYRVIDLIGHGPNGGLVNGAKSIYLDDVQLQADDGTWNFEGVTWTERTGLPDQSPLPGFPAVETTVLVGVNVLHDTPITRTITNPDLDAVRVHLAMPSLWQQFDNGDLKGSTLQFTLEVVGHSAVTKTISDKFMSTYEVDYLLSLPAGQAPWDIRVTRVTADSTTSKLANGLAWSTYTEVLNHRLIYPDSHIIGGAIDASLFGGKIPRRSYDVYGRIIKVPSNYDPQTRVYTGIWDGTWQQAWSNNAAWCFYDMLEHDGYGLGLTAPDKWALYPIAQYCDELVPDGFGGMEPRFCLDCVINTRHEAYALINTMASVFMGMPIWSTGSVTVFQDAPADPQILATPANVIGGLFSYEGTGRKSRATVAYVTWNDPANGGKPTIEPVVNRAAVRKYGYIEKEVVAFGCNRRGQAHRIGKWLTDTADAEKETVTYRTGLDHAFILPGMIVAIADPWVANVRMGGRLRDGFATEAGGANLVEDIGLWGVSTGATRAAAGTAPDGSTAWTLTDADAALYGFTTSAYEPYDGGVYLCDIMVAKDTVADRVVLLRIINYNGSSYLDFRLRTDTGEWLRNGVGGAIFSSWAIYDLGEWWRIRVAGTVSGGTTIRVRFYPAIGPDLNSNTVATIGSATIAGAKLWDADGLDLTLFDPTKTLRLDAPVTLAPDETYTITVMLPDGTAEQQAVINPPGETESLSLVAALSDVPVTGAVWVVTGTDIAPRLWRVLHKSEVDAGTYQIIAAEHDPNKYARIELGIQLDTPDYARPQSSGPVLPPNNPQLLLKAYYADGRLQNMLVFAWQAAADDRVNAYQVRYRVDDDQWNTMAPDSGFLAEKRDVQAGHHYFQVRSVTRTGGFSIWAEDDLEITQATMPDVTGLVLVDCDSATTFTGGDARFAWDSVALSEIASPGGTDPWFKSYVVEVWKGGALVRTEYPVIPEYVYSFEKNTADGGPDRSFGLRVYQLGNLGQLSTTPAVLAVSNPVPSMAGFTPVVNAVFKGLKIDWSPWGSSDTDLQYIKVYLDTDPTPTTLVATLSAEAIGYTETGLDVGVGYQVRLVPGDAFGDGVASDTAAGTPLILAGVDVDIELAESITMSDSLSTPAATLAKLYDRNTTSDGLVRTLGGADQWIQYQFGLTTYIDKVILHLADANARAYFAYSADGETWSWLAAEADHTLDAAGRLVAAASQLAAQGAYLQMAAGLNVAVFPQRVTAKYCRIYLTGTYTTTIYELVFVREVIAEQVVADNLSAISSNLGSIVAGYMQSTNYTDDTGVKFDLNNSEMHLGGGNGGVSVPGLSYDVTNGLRLVGDLVNTNPATGDYARFSSGDLSFFFNDGAGNFYQYKSVKKMLPGTAANGVLFTIPGYWRTAPQIFPALRGIPVYKAAYGSVDQRLDVSSDPPVQISAGRWQTKIYARLNTNAGVVALNYPNVTSTAPYSYGVNVVDTDFSTTQSSVANVVSVTCGCSLTWTTYFTGNYAQHSSITLSAYVDGVEKLLYSASKNAPYPYTGTPYTVTSAPTITVPLAAGVHSIYFKLVVTYYGSSAGGGSSTATISNVKASCNIGANSFLASGDVNYLAYSED